MGEEEEGGGVEEEEERKVEVQEEQTAERVRSSSLHSTPLWGQYTWLDRRLNILPAYGFSDVSGVSAFPVFSVFLCFWCASGHPLQITGCWLWIPMERPLALWPSGPVAL